MKTTIPSTDFYSSFNPTLFFIKSAVNVSSLNLWTAFHVVILSTYPIVLIFELTFISNHFLLYLRRVFPLLPFPSKFQNSAYNCWLTEGLSVVVSGAVNLKFYRHFFFFFSAVTDVEWSLSFQSFSGWFSSISAYLGNCLQLRSQDIR